MKFPHLRGVYAAAITPLKPDYSPDLDAFPALIDFFAQRGCHGVLLLGTTGEGPSFEPQERAAIFKASAEARSSHPGFHLLVGTGTPSLRETILLNQAAFEAGLDGVVVLPPYYYKKAGDDGLFQWFSQVIQLSVPPEKPLLGYHIPAVSGVGLSIDLLRRLLEAFPDRFAGLKDSSGDPDMARQLGKTFGENLMVFNGNDKLFSLALGAGASGCITAMANVFSPQLRQVWDTFAKGQADISAQAWLTSAREVMDRYPPAPALYKTLLAKWHHLPLWQVRPPLLPLAQEQTEKALADLAAVTR